MNLQSSKSIKYNQSHLSKEKSLASLSPKARQDIELEMRISESQNKIVFRDFAVPVHNGKGRVDPKSLVKTSTGGSRIRSRPGGSQQVDIISNKVQTTL